MAGAALPVYMPPSTRTQGKPQGTWSTFMGLSPCDCSRIVVSWHSRPIHRAGGAASQSRSVMKTLFGSGLYCPKGSQYLNPYC